jgi:hypothetical protein
MNWNHPYIMNKQALDLASARASLGALGEKAKGIFSKGKDVFNQTYSGARANPLAFKQDLWQGAGIGALGGGALGGAYSGLQSLDGNNDVNWFGNIARGALAGGAGGALTNGVRGVASRDLATKDRLEWLSQNMYNTGRTGQVPH